MRPQNLFSPQHFISLLLNYMDYYSDSDRKIASQALLVVSEARKKLDFNSLLASFSNVCISIMATTDIVAWVQQHQPDLIILDLEWSEVVNSQLISTLRLDWLTRNIPILLITDAPESQALANLDYDARLNKSCSPLKLEQTIRSLTSIATDNIWGKAV